MGAWFTSFGVALIILGGLISRFPRLVAWFGHLPGDFRIRLSKRSLLIPLSSAGILSIGAIVIVAILSRYLTRW